MSDTKRARPILNDKTADILLVILDLEAKIRGLGRSDQQRLLLALEEIHIACQLRGDSARIAHDKRLAGVADTLTLRGLDVLTGFRISLHSSGHGLDFRGDAELNEALHDAGPVEPPQRESKLVEC
jgi:hypothetical protein